MSNKKAKYYIWNTVGDDKVRSSHAELDGMIFSWDDPPLGGHPGEAPNCRCTAEDYFPPEEGDENVEYGDRTQAKILEYLIEEQKEDRSNMSAKELMEDNLNKMQKHGWKEADKFFHCKANFEAAKKGPLGATTAVALSKGREIGQSYFGKQTPKERDADEYANYLGIKGAIQRKNLLESCQPHHKHYYK